MIHQPIYYFLTSIASLPFSNIIFLSEVSKGRLTFTWSPVSVNCPAVHYNITAINCGICSDAVTKSNFVTCNIASTLSPTCTLTVQTVANVCGVTLETVRKLVVYLIKGRL